MFLFLLGLSLVFLSSCSDDSTVESKVMENGYLTAISSAYENISGYSDDSNIESKAMEYDDLMSISSAYENITLTQSKQINESLPTFDFYIRLGSERFFDVNFEHPFRAWATAWRPETIFVEIELTVKENGEITQIIDGIYVNINHSASTMIYFQDFNFDGYLDLQIPSHQAFSEGHMVYSYFFIWDTETSRFILNEQLMEIGYAASISANAQTNKIEVWHRTVTGATLALYSYCNGIFVRQEHENTQKYETPAIIEIAHPPINIQINENLPEFIIHRYIGDVIDEWWEPRFDVRLEIRCADGEFFQEITGLVQGSHFAINNSVAIESSGQFSEFGLDANYVHRSDHTFEFADLNFNGYLDMILRSSRDSGMGRFLEQYFWMWDAESSMFVLNEQLMEIGHNKFDVYANRETMQIEAMGLSETYVYIDFYVYNNGVFEKVQEAVIERNR